MLGLSHLRHWHGGGEEKKLAWAGTKIHSIHTFTMLFFGVRTHWHSFRHLQRRLHRNGPEQVWFYHCGTADWTRGVAWPILNVWVSLRGIILTFSLLILVACCNTAWECHQMCFYLCHKFSFCFLFLLITSVSLTHWQRVLRHFTNLTWLVNCPDTIYWLL